MSINLPEIEEIYFSQTREYFQEVISSYSIGNYRSATVMLYSVAICDILLKLKELKDMYNDTVAKKILNEIEKSRTSHDKKSKSKWEKDLVETIKEDTKLLSLEAYTHLNHLYDDRNFSAHPAINEDYELIKPSKETTIANIKNILKDILIKPPIFINNVIDALTEDLKDKKDIFIDNTNELSVYLNNKYFSKMPNSMKCATVKAFWKFCFTLPNDVECTSNCIINRLALGVLVEGFYDEVVNYIKENPDLFGVANDKNCSLNLAFFLSKHEKIYGVLNSETILIIDSIIEKDDHAKAVAWFKFQNPSEHFDYLKSNLKKDLDKRCIEDMFQHYSNYGEEKRILDFFIWYYGESECFDSADYRFEHVIAPFLNKMIKEQFEEIIRCSNVNSQIYYRRLAYSANNTIMEHAKKLLESEFDYSQYSFFEFDNTILQLDEKPTPQ